MKWPGVFLIGAVVFFLSWGELRAADKYSPRQRFGYGYSSTEPLANFDYASLRAGWFFNWSDTLPNEIYVPVGMDYFGLVGGYSKTNFPADINDTECVALRQKIQAKPALYPDKMSWLVGNEIGWDDQRTSDEYAEAFVAWFDCLKSINATFKVGTGALMSPRRYLPKSEGQAPPYWCEYQPGSQSACWCVKAGTENSDPHSSLNYFRRYLDRIREIDPAKMPDFINQHLYPLIDCYEDSLETENLKEHIRSYRTVMKEKGLQNLDLIISEWGPLDRRITDSAAIGRFMSEMSDFFFRARDPALGLPADDYRLVQRWAWFVFTFSDSSTNPNNYPNLHLFDPISRQITQVGESYRQVAARYVSDFFCPVCPAGVLAKDQGNANCDAKINGLDFAWWAKGDPAADFNCQTGQISPIVDLADFYLWLVNYGQI